MWTLQVDVITQHYPTLHWWIQRFAERPRMGTERPEGRVAGFTRIENG